MAHRPTRRPADAADYRRPGVVDLRRGLHSAPVLTETETEATIEVPAPFAPDQSFGQPPFPGGLPPMVKKTVKRIDVATIVEPEPMLMRELSVGGVARIESGELKRTYSGSKGPALCPS